MHCVDHAGTIYVAEANWAGGPGQILIYAPGANVNGAPQRNPVNRR